MKKAVLIIVITFAMFSEISELPVIPEAQNIDIAAESHEVKIKKPAAKGATPDAYMDGVVVGKSMDMKENTDSEIIYHLYIRTNKGRLRKFETTMKNYSLLDKGYSVHYILTGSRSYKLVRYKAPDL